MNKFIIAVPRLRLTFTTLSKRRSGLEFSLFCVRFIMDKSAPGQIFYSLFSITFQYYYTTAFIILHSEIIDVLKFQKLTASLNYS